MNKNDKNFFVEANPYSAVITREQYLFYEVRTTAKLILDKLTPEEIVNKITEDNLFQYPTEKSVKRMAIACLKRLDREKQIELVREYVKENFVKVGMCADIALHDKNDGNPHAHILLTMRPLNEDTTWGAKSKKEYILDEIVYKKDKRVSKSFQL